MGEKKPLTLRDAAQDSFCILPKFQHGNRFHMFNFNFKLNKRQDLKNQPERKTPPALALDPEFFGALFSIEVPKAKLSSGREIVKPDTTGCPS